MTVFAVSGLECVSPGPDPIRRPMDIPVAEIRRISAGSCGLLYRFFDGDDLDDLLRFSDVSHVTSYNQVRTSMS